MINRKQIKHMNIKAVDALSYIALLGIVFMYFYITQQDSFQRDNEDIKVVLADKHLINRFEIKPSKINNLTLLCKVWGILKYYHPNVQKGGIDIDDILISALTSINGNKTSANSFDLAIQQMIGKCGTYSTINIPETQNLKNQSFNWLIEGNYLEDESVSKLFNIIQAGSNICERYYVKNDEAGNATFTNEKKYSINHPNTNLYLLSLFRYWNVIQYFYPYKYVITNNWEAVLDKQISNFLSISNKNEYIEALYSLTKEIQDSHVSLKFSNIEVYPKSENIYIANLDTKYIEGKLIAMKPFVFKEGVTPILKSGDIITHINDIPIHKIRANSNYHISASNCEVLERDLNYMTLRSNMLENNLTYIRDNDTITQRVIFDKGDLLWEEYQKQFRKYAKKQVGVWLSDSIAYIDLAKIYTNATMSLVPLINSKGIIIDLRCYPNNSYQDICNFFLTQEKDFFKFTYPDMCSPSSFLLTTKKAQKIGNYKIEHIYKGKLVILVDETTQSHGEFTAMALQTIPNSVTIGSRTAGTDGNVSTINLPDGASTTFSGIGIYYPDGTETQKRGVKIDIEVLYTLKNVRDEIDPMIKRAMNYINN